MILLLRSPFFSLLLHQHQRKSRSWTSSFLSPVPCPFQHHLPSSESFLFLLSFSFFLLLSFTRNQSRSIKSFQTVSQIEYIVACRSLTAKFSSSSSLFLFFSFFFLFDLQHSTVLLPRPFPSLSHQFFRYPILFFPSTPQENHCITSFDPNLDFLFLPLSFAQILNRYSTCIYPSQLKTSRCCRLR